MDTLLAICLIAALGYLAGGIRIKGIELGTAGVLLVALVFGHFGVTIPAVIRNFGLACFVCSVGLLSGPKFFRDFRINAASYILLGAIVILSGALLCILFILVTGIPAELAVGLLTGALTSTPGLAAAQEASGSSAALATTGYAIAYPFGVIGVVLFVQLIPRLLHADMRVERARFEAAHTSAPSAPLTGLFRPDEGNFFAFMAAILLGILVGKLNVPLPGGASFSLGTTGGPLIVGLLFGHFAHIGPVDLRVPSEELKLFRELGLMFFLIGAGTDGGAGFLETLRQEGGMLFVYGSVMTLFPMLVGYWVARRFLKLQLLNNLGSITGGMTSTPALGTLIRVAGIDEVASAYAATYPIALVAIVLCAQFIVILFG